MRWDSLKPGDVLIHDGYPTTLGVHMVLSVAIGAVSDNYDTLLCVASLDDGKQAVWECDTYVGRSYSVIRGRNELEGKS